MLVRKQVERAVQLARLILGDLGGRAEERHEQGGMGRLHVIHIRRPLRPEEEQLTPGWFQAATPTDRAGGCPIPFRIP
jgi:hypothetical protein